MDVRDFGRVAITSEMSKVWILERRRWFFEENSLISAISSTFFSFSRGIYGGLLSSW